MLPNCFLTFPGPVRLSVPDSHIHDNRATEHRSKHLRISFFYRTDCRNFAVILHIFGIYLCFIMLRKMNRKFLKEVFIDFFRLRYDFVKNLLFFSTNSSSVRLISSLLPVIRCPPPEKKTDVQPGISLLQYFAFSGFASLSSSEWIMRTGTLIFLKS